MNRKEFFKKSLQMGLASGWMMLLKGKHAFARSSGRKSGQVAKDPKQKFKEDWITSLMQNLDGQLDQETRVKLMESCGRDCARRGAIRMAEFCKGDVEKLVKILAEYLGKENAYIEGNVIHLGYSKCLCDLVAEGPERLSDTYCYCSRGWALQMFETAAQKPVKVELLQSIKRGDPSCKFLIEL